MYDPIVISYMMMEKKSGHGNVNEKIDEIVLLEMKYTDLYTENNTSLHVLLQKYPEADTI